MTIAGCAILAERDAARPLAGTQYLRRAFSLRVSSRIATQARCGDEGTSGACNSTSTPRPPCGAINPSARCAGRRKTERSFSFRMTFKACQPIEVHAVSSLLMVSNNHEATSCVIRPARIVHPCQA